MPTTASPLDRSIRTLKGVGSKLEGPLASLGIRTVGDLLLHLPHRHEDLSAGIPLSDIKEGANVAVDATVVHIQNRRSFGKRRLSITNAILTDGDTEIKAVWFNQPYLVRNLHEGAEYRFSGKVSTGKFGLQLNNPSFSRAGAAERTADGDSLLPVYPLTTGVPQRTLRRLVAQAIGEVEGIEDPIPSDVRGAYGLMGKREAVRIIHVPGDRASLAKAQRSLAFDEVFRLQLAVGTTRRQREQGKAQPIPFDQATVKAFVESLPFELTDDQRKAGWEAITAMQKPVPMHRLLDGDVGSGKTAVAALIAANVVHSGFQAAIMVPTEILSAQHFASFTRMFAPHDVTVALWTNAYKASSKNGTEIVAKGKAERDALADSIARGEVGIVIGTHALAVAAFTFHSLAFAVIDEQHRFGVNTRRKLKEKGGAGPGSGSGAGQEPHLLSMTATPIPRTLALTMYGDLDISLLKEKPAGRRPIVTKVVAPSRREATYAAIRKAIGEGRQAFFVCPLIDKSDMLDVESVTELVDRLKTEIFPDITIGMLHGKMPSSEKEEVMARFSAGKTSILVSTSVVEVGVDVPNATVMCIEGAERFGLAQLHQFRGRVGRGAHASQCYLFPSTGNPVAIDRLKAMEVIDDGFALAEKDLRIRGPGDILGEAQSGFLPTLMMASAEDLDLLKDARTAAERILDADPALEAHPALRSMLDKAFNAAHLE